MKTFLISALAFGILTSAALAESVVLSDAQLDTVTAGQANVNQAITQTATQTGEANAIGGTATVTQTVEQNATQEGTASSIGAAAE